jgi:hypothetical protein
MEARISRFATGGAELVTGATLGAHALAVLEDGDILVVNGSAR